MLEYGIHNGVVPLLQAALRGAQFHGGPFDENHGAYFPPVHETFLDEASSPFNFVV